MFPEHEYVSEPTRLEASLCVRIDLRRESNYVKQKKVWGKEIAAEISKETEKLFGEPIQLKIGIKKGSIVVIVCASATAICAFLSCYGSVRSGLSSLSQDVSWLFKKAALIIKRVIGPKYIKEVIEEKMQLGPIAAMDELLQIYINGKISENNCTEGLVCVFRAIENRKDRDRLFPVAIKYIDNVYGNAYPVDMLIKRISEPPDLPTEDRDRPKQGEKLGLSKLGRELSENLRILEEIDSAENEEDRRCRLNGPDMESYIL